MPYSKQTWQNAPSTATPLSAERLNHIEDGIETAQATAEAGGDPVFTQIVGDGTTGPFVVQHNLGTRIVDVVVRRATAPFDRIWVRDEASTADTVTLLPDTALAANGFYVTVKFVAQSDETPPTPPTIAFVSKTAHSITVKMTAAATDDSGVLGYYWHVDGVRQSGSPVEATVEANVELSGLSGSTEYDIHLTAVDTYGNESDPSNVVTQTTNAPSDVTPPTAGTATLSSKDEDSITYTFTAGSDNVGVVRVDAHDGSGALLDDNVTSPWTRTGLTAATEYSTFFRYYDAADNHADSNTVVESTDASLPVGPVARVAGTGDNDYRITPDANPVSQVPTFTVPDNGKPHSALVWLSVSHSVNNNPPTYDVLSAVSDVDGAATELQRTRIGQFAAQSQGAIIVFGFTDITPGEHNVTVTVERAATAFTSMMVHVDVYENAGSFGTPVSVEGNSAPAISNTVPSVEVDNMAAWGVVCIAEETFSNGTMRYANGGSVTGSGDWMYVRDLDGTGGDLTLSGSSGVHSSIGVEVIKAA